jgi:CubicO group peptidase (beta-lactamase class C family)
MPALVQSVACGLASCDGAGSMRGFSTRPFTMNPSLCRGAAAVLLLTPLAALAQSLPDVPDAAAVSRYANELLDSQRIAADAPGITLLVARDKELLVKAARGAANIELGVALKPEHQMRLGSITKQFAAASLLRLIDEGKAKLDDPLSKFLPDYPNGSAITLLQLLNHSSGVKSYTGIPGYMLNPIRRDLTTAQLIAEFKDQPVDFAPGTQHRYNNSGYVLLGAVVEAISGKPWHEMLEQQLLAPVKVAVAYEAPGRLLPGMVSGYTRGPKGVAPAGLLSMTQPHAAGALVGNVESLWRWNQALHEGGLLKPESYRAMVTPQGAAKDANYGFGIGTGQVRGTPMLQHGGGIHGFNTQLIYLPQQRITVALLRNADSGGVNLDGLSRQLAAFTAGKPYPAIKPVALKAEQLKDYEGVYSRDKDSRSLRVVDGVLVSTRSGSRPIPLTPLGNDRFAFADTVAQLQFQRGADGKVSTQIYYPDADEAGGGSEAWARSGELPTRPEIALSDAQLQALLGSYANERLEIRVYVDDKGQLRGQAVGQGPVTLKASSPRELFIVEIDASLSFAPAEGLAQVMTLQQGQGRFELKRKQP